MFLILLLLILVAAVGVICLWRSYKRRQADTAARGEYRAVAARYGDMSFDNTFSDVLSDDELEDDSWNVAGGKRVLEMSTLSNGRGDDDGLSLEEMNG